MLDVLNNFVNVVDVISKITKSCYPKPILFPKEPIKCQLSNAIVTILRPIVRYTCVFNHFHMKQHLALEHSHSKFQRPCLKVVNMIVSETLQKRCKICQNTDICFTKPSHFFHIHIFICLLSVF